MADVPLAAAGTAEQVGGGEDEPAPAPHPQAGFGAADFAEYPTTMQKIR
jgi:hypothetical protein